MNTIRGSQGWRNADAHAEPADHYLTMMAEVLAVGKKQANDLLRLKPGSRAIEIGCGLGRDAEELATRVGPTGRIVGVDASQELIAKATARTASLGLPLRFQVDDAHTLSFSDNSFDGGRAERVLQHLDDPERAVHELVRVVRPGGRIAIIEPDWETVVVGGLDHTELAALLRHIIEVSITNGRIGRELRRLLVDAGCVEVTAETSILNFGSLKLADEVMNLRSNLDGACAQGWISEAQRDKWWRDAEALHARGAFFAWMCGVHAGATVA